MERQTVITGVLNDIHHLGLVLVGGALTEAGFNVVYLGTHLTQEDLVNAALETNASAIFVSQSCGHALIDTRGLREKCREAGIGDIILYLGGSNLIIDPAGEYEWEKVENTFKDLGFTRVYSQNTSIKQVVDDLKTDIKAGINPAEV